MAAPLKAEWRMWPAGPGKEAVAPARLPPREALLAQLPSPGRCLPAAGSHTLDTADVQAI